MKAKSLFCLLIVSINCSRIFAQCSGGLNGGALSPAPSSSYQTMNTTTGNYYTFTVPAGCMPTYDFSYCSADGSNANFDSQITILDNTGVYAGGYSDDFCGVQSHVTWTPSAPGTYRVLVNTFSCSSGNSATLAYKATIPPNMSFSSNTTVQSSLASVSTCDLNQNIICVQVVTAGSCNALSLTQFQLGAGTSTNANLADVSKIHIYYTGNTNAFNTTNEFVSGGTTPAGGNNTINGSQTLASGTNYFWIAYDINPAATIGNLVDASCSQITVSATNYTPTTTNPVGARPVVVCSAYPGTSALNLMHWVKSDAGVTGSPVSAWADQSGASITGNMVQATAANQPTIQSGAVNFQDYLRFDGVNDILVSANSFAGNSLFHATDNTILIVKNIKSGLVDYKWESTPTGSYRVGEELNGTAQRIDFVNDGTGKNALSTTNIVNKDVLVEFISDASSLTLKLNSNSDATISHSNTFSPGATTKPLNIGSNDLGNPLYCNVDIAEVMTFNKKLSSSELPRVESYLCLKYGITSGNNRGAGAAVTYMSSDGTQIWNGQTGYHNYVIGLGRDNAPGNSLLNKLKTTSVTSLNGSRDIVTLANHSLTAPTAIANDKSFLISGSNAGALSPLLTVTQTHNGPATPIQYQLARVWATQKTGTWVDSLMLQFDMSQVNGGTSANASLRLLVDDNSNFYDGSAGEHTYSPNAGYSATGGLVNFTVPYSDIQNGTGYYTLGLINPTLTVTVNSATICPGGSATLTASGATSYSWTPSTGLSATTGSTVVASPATTQVYTVTGTTGAATGSSTSTVTVAGTLTVTANSPTICSGTSGTLVATGASSYTWTPSTGSSSLNGDTLITNPTSTTIYTVTGSSGTCSSSYTTSITVNATPTVSANSLPATICSGTTATLTASGANSYTWSTGTSASSTTVSPSSTNSYTVTGESNSCTDSTVVTVPVTPLPSLTVTASSGTVCPGQSSTLSASGATTFTWSSNAGSVQTSTVSVSPSGTTTYTLSGTDNGCTDSTTVIVNVSPSPTVTIAASPTVICRGQTATLTAYGASTYTWNTGVNDTTIFVTPTSNTTYTAVGSSAGGCLDSTTITIGVDTMPVLSVSASPSVICAGQVVTLTGGGASNLTWLPGSATGTTYSVTLNNTATFTLTGTNGACSASTAITVTVNPLPTINISPSPANICSGQSTTLTASGATSYTWSANALSAQTNTVSVSPANSDIYTVTGYSLGCLGTQTVAVNVGFPPVINAIQGEAACSGTQMNPVNFSVTPSNANINWVATNNTNVGLPASGTGSSIPGYTAPSVSTSQTATVTVTATDAVSGCPSSSQSFTMMVNPLPVVTPGVYDTAACGLNNGGVHGININSNSTYTVQWYSGLTLIPNATSATLSGVAAGTYSIHVQDANGCVATGSQVMYTVPGTTQPIAVIGATPTTGLAPLAVSFTGAGSTGGTNYLWNFGNGSSANTPNASTTYTASGTYTATLMVFNHGCMDEDTVTIIVNDATTLVVPNVFSPNGDGINDAFTILTTGMRTLACDIFNRWGQKVFSLSSPGAKWDGTLDNGHTATEGTYYYVLEAVGNDGKTYSVKGDITLVR